MKENIMGDRALIQVVQNELDKAPAVIYLHWGGDTKTVTRVIKESANVMRYNDTNYATARLIQAFCNLHEGGLSVGVYESLDDIYAEDNGVYTVMLDSGTVWQNGELVEEKIYFGRF